MSENKFNPTYDNLRQAGYILIPCNGKVCALKPSWKERDEFTDAEWKRATDIAVRTGEQKDGSFLSCIDVDTKDTETVAFFFDVILEAGNKPGFNYYLEESVHGYHAFFKTSEPVGSSRKMWRREGKEKDDIELKAGVAYVRIYPCAGFKVHEGALENLKPIDSSAFLSIVDSLTNIRSEAKKPVAVTARPVAGEEKPTDYINAHPELFLAFLQSKDWEVLWEDDERWTLKRPGSTGAKNVGATVAKKDGMFYPWSSKLNCISNQGLSPTNFIASEYYGGNFDDARRFIRETMMPVTIPEDFTVNFGESPKGGATVAKMSGEGFKLTAENVMAKNIRVTDVIAWGEECYKPWQFNEGLFEGRAMFNDALKATKADNYPQTHGMFLASLASTSACCARFVVGKEGKYTVHPAVYAGLALETGGGKNQCFKFIDEIQRVIKRFCKPYSITIRDIEEFNRMANPLDVNFGNLRDAVERCLAREDGEDEAMERVVHLRFFNEVGYADRLPATPQGFISSECVCGSTFYAQDEFGDFAKARGGDKQAICSIVKELFTNQDRTFSEAVTKTGINENNIRRVESPYLNLFFAFAPDSGVEGWLKRSTQDGFTGRLSIGCGVKKTYHSFDNCWDVDCADRVEDDSLSPDTIEWIKSYLRGVQQHNVSNYRVQVVSKTRKKVVYEILPPEFPRRFEIRFSSEAMSRIGGIQRWLEDKESNERLNETYRFILSRKTQNLSTYALLSFLSKRKFNFGVDGEEVGVDDVMWAFDVLLHELACLPHIIHADLANASDADVEDVERDRKMEAYEYQVYRYIVAHQGVTKSELSKAKSTSDHPLPPLRQRAEIVQKLVESSQLRVIPNTVNHRERQELFPVRVAGDGEDD